MRQPDASQAGIRSAVRRRRTLGLTQDDAANLLGMSRVTYHRIETGRPPHFVLSTRRDLRDIQLPRR